MLTMYIFCILDGDFMGIGDDLVLFPLGFSGPVYRHKLLISDHNNRFPSLKV
jgi:hypothetical protein